MKDSFNDLTFDELIARRDELVKDYRTARFDKEVGHLDNPLSVRETRRKIARVKTIIHEYETGIRQKGTAS